MKNIDNEDAGTTYRYFYAHDNQTVFEKPFTVSDRSDLASMLETLEDESLFGNFHSSRPNTKWRFHMLTNVTFKASLHKAIPLGCQTPEIPDFITHRRDVQCLVRNYGTGKNFDDNLCMFRALVSHKTQTSKRGIEASTMELFEKFIHALGSSGKQYFRGVKTSDISLLENIANVNINIYSASKSQDGTVCGEQLRRSLGLKTDTCHLLQIGKHVCYINNLETLFHRYKCVTCGKFFNHRGHLNRHTKLYCSDSVRNIYPGKIYNITQTIFEKLEEIGITVDKNDRLFSNFAIFDFETICSAKHQQESTATFQYVGKHIPVSVSICNNFMSLEPLFIHNSDPQQLVIDFINYLEKLSDVNVKIQFDRYALVFNALKDFHCQLTAKVNGKFRPRHPFQHSF